jgi:uncharacterized membrane protein
MSKVLRGEGHPKQDFQVERIAFFSDAVYAIAITLLVIEIRAPIIGKDTTHAELWHELKEMKLKLLALLFSFLLIITYWVRHHTLFKHIHNYNKKIIMANMFTLLPIIFFPFTTSFLYESIASDNELIVVPYRIFFLNHVLAGVSTYYFYWMVMKRYKEVSYPMSREDAGEFENKLFVMTISFALIFVLSFISFKYSVLGVLPIAFNRLYIKFFKKDKKNIIHAEQKSSAGN